MTDDTEPAVNDDPVCETVEDALSRETADGPGDLDNLPASDFVSFAADDVGDEE